MEMQQQHHCTLVKGIARQKAKMLCTACSKVSHSAPLYHGIVYLLSEPAPDLFSDALCNAHGRHTPRLRAAYLASRCVACLGQVLCHLGRLTRASLSDDHQHLDSVASNSGTLAPAMQYTIVPSRICSTCQAAYFHVCVRKASHHQVASLTAGPQSSVPKPHMDSLSHHYTPLTEEHAANMMLDYSLNHL